MTLEKRILVADDDGPIRALVATVLRRRGFAVDVVGDGDEAVVCLAETRYGLLVLDLMMPRVSGYEVIEYIRALPLPNRPLVIVLTAGFEPRTFDTSIVLGTIHKPFDVEMLVDTVAAALGAVPESKPVVESGPTPASGLRRDPEVTN